MELRELTWKERGRLWMRMGIRLVLAVAVVLLLVLAVPPLLSLFMPFVLALIMAWLLNPVVRWLHRKLKLSRRIGSLLVILLVFATVGGALTWFVYNIGTEVYSLVTNWSSMGEQIAQALDEVGQFFDRFITLLPDQISVWIEKMYVRLVNWLQEVVPTLLTSLGRGAGNVAVKVPSAVVAAIVFVMASYMICADYPHLRFQITERMSTPVRDFFGRVRNVAFGAFGGYVKAEFILSVGVFFILLVGFFFLRQSYALLLAFVLAVLDFIPIIGAGTVMVPWAVIDLVMGNFRHALGLMVVWGIICLFRRVAEPKVVGDQTGLSPILSLISIYVGMQLGGVLGMILGPVVVLIVLNILKMDVFAGARRDVHMAVDDVRAMLAIGKEDAP